MIIVGEFATPSRNRVRSDTIQTNPLNNTIYNHYVLAENCEICNDPMNFGPVKKRALMSMAIFEFWKQIVFASIIKLLNSKRKLIQTIALCSLFI